MLGTPDVGILGWIAGIPGWMVGGPGESVIIDRSSDLVLSSISPSSISLCSPRN